MTTNESHITRVPSGNPAGGRFSAHDRAESTLTLHGPHDVVGYTWRAENYSGENLIEAMVKAGELSPGARGMSVEDALNQHAGANAIDREDEYSFDSDDFPKTVSGDQLACSDGDWAGDQAPDHLVVGDEFPYCASCGAEFDELSTLEGGDDPAVVAAGSLSNSGLVDAGQQALELDGF